jgi:hypothetical protein
MKKIFSSVLGIISCVAAFAVPNYDAANSIPEIRVAEDVNFQKIDNVAQYGLGDWSCAIGIARGISRSEAIRIANANPEITFFFYTKGLQMVLGTPDGNWRVFRHGDTVFFKGEPWWGSATDLADGYVKKQN